jgi:hypothetical protein
MISVLRIHSIRGDDEFRWEPGVDDERLHRAREQFERARQRQFFAYSRTREGDTRLLHEFDPDAREILMAIPLAGG